MAESRMAILIPPVEPGYHSLTVDTHTHTLQAAVSQHGLLLYIPHPYFLLHDLMRSFFRLRNKLVTALYPIHPLLALAVVVFMAAYVILAPRDSWVRSGALAEVLWAIDEHMPFSSYFPLQYRLLYLSSIATLSGLLAIVTVQRLILRLLLHYKGWVHDPPGKTSTLTKIWATALTYLFLKRGKLLTFSFQDALPRLHVPPLHSTLEKFMRSVKPLLSEEKYSELEKEREQFAIHQGPKLQRYLIIRSWMTSNYISEWWLRFIYLRGRSSIYINSNYYGSPSYFPKECFSRNQITRAANLIYQFMRLKRKLDQEELPPIVTGVHPLCMDQYRRMFSTTRIPHREEDTLAHYDSADSRHIVVQYKGLFYRVNVYRKNGSLLSPYDLQEVLKHIAQDREGKAKKEKPISEAEANLAALTTMDRTKWAEVRSDHFSVGVNHYSLSQIERAIFVVNLEDDSPATTQDLCRGLFMGTGGTRWCDKSFSLVIYANGLSGVHAEHAWADAPVISHSMEMTTTGELMNRNWDEETGEIKPDKTFDAATLPPPQRIRFHLSEDLEAIVLDAYKSALDAKSNLQLVLYDSPYGKNAMKKCRLSPDSFVQMTLQLAYFRNQRTFALTYESAMMRLFKDGRTETIRSLSLESVEFVKAMDDPKVSAEEKRRLHKIAVEGHNNYAKMASIGDGVDRHLFALYVVAMGTETEAKFLREALQIPWKLSTSQIPHRMYDGWPKDDNRGDNPLYRCVGGGFGPVADDGYGVCYCFTGESRTNFHISSKRSCAETDSQQFAECLDGAFKDILSLYN